jgi:Ca2+-binding RTX toxin-like protein
MTSIRLIATAAAIVGTVVLSSPAGGALEVASDARLTGLVPGPKGSLLCFGAPATIVGTEGPDNADFGTPPIVGTAGADVIVALGGDDVVDGLGGDDKICGGDGDDFMFGNAGNDQMDGGGGDIDFVSGGPGDDTLDGGSGMADFVNYLCVPGISLFACPTTGVQVDLASGVATGEGSDQLARFEGIDGSLYADTLVGDDGFNLFIGETGDDSFDGAGGFDLVTFLPAVVANLSTGLAVGEGSDRLSGVEGLDGPAGSVLVGDANDNILRGAVLDGATPSGGSILEGGAGDDLLIGSVRDDRIDGRGGADTLSGDAGNDILDGGESRSDVASYLRGPAVNVNLRRGVADGWGHDSLIGIEDVSGSQFADVIVGNAESNGLFGNGGDDQLIGREGNDGLIGGSGRNGLAGRAGADYCVDAFDATSCETLESESVIPARAGDSRSVGNAGRARANATQTASATLRGTCGSPACASLAARAPAARIVADRRGRLDRLTGTEALLGEQLQRLYGQCRPKRVRDFVTIAPPEEIPGAGTAAEWTATLHGVTDLKGQRPLDTSPTARAADLSGSGRGSDWPLWTRGGKPYGKAEFERRTGTYRFFHRIHWTPGGNDTGRVAVYFKPRTGFTPFCRA